MSTDPQPPNSFEEMRQLARNLETRGATTLQVIDALFRSWLHASVHFAGRDGMAETLRDMASQVAGEELETPPTTH